MKEIWYISRGVFAALGGFLSWFFGSLDFMLYVLITLAICDYITGVMCAVVNKKLSSAVGFRGIFKKMIMFIVVGIAHLFDRMMNTGDVLRTAAVFFYIANECVSLIENAAVIGLPVPETLKKVLAQIKKNSDANSKAGGAKNEQPK